VNGSTPDVSGAVLGFEKTFTLEDAIEFHAFLRLKRGHACDQWHLSRVFIPRLPVGTANSVQTPKAASGGGCQPAALTISSATALMTSRNTEGRHPSTINPNHELCHHTDGVTPLKAAPSDTRSR
jgi:hypothetical protein